MKIMATRNDLINVYMVVLFVKIAFILAFVCPADNSFGVIVASEEALQIHVTSASQSLLSAVANASVNCYICSMSSCQLLPRHGMKENKAVWLM